MKSLLLYTFIFFATSVISQTSYTFDIDSTQKYEPYRDAKEAVYKIVKYTGLTPNFLVIEEDVPTVIAYIKGGKRYIAYNPDFIRKVKSNTNTNWAAVSILAHEIGHHLSGHTIKLKGSNPGDELIADRFSGFILYKMGASLNDAKAALNSIGYSLDTINHPPINSRLDAISFGWNEAKEIDNTNAYDESDIQNCRLKTLIYKCIFDFDENIYFIDDMDRIIWFDNYGKEIVIGNKKPSEDKNYSWLYEYKGKSYGVDYKGNIWSNSFQDNQFKIGKIFKVNCKM